MFIYKHTPRRTRLGDLCPSPTAITTSLPRSLSPYSCLTVLPSILSPPCSLRGRPPVRLFFFLSFTIIQIRPRSSSFSCRFRSMSPQHYLLFPVSICNSVAQSLKQILIQAPFLRHVKKKTVTVQQRHQYPSYTPQSKGRPPAAWQLTSLLCMTQDTCGATSHENYHLIFSETSIFHASFCVRSNKAWNANMQASCLVSSGRPACVTCTVRVNAAPCFDLFD